MGRRIPPLNPLRMFEVVARTENLTTAARELNVSQSAVSRQIVVLENYLGIELFKRERHGVVLTDAGKKYSDLIIPAFETIAEATQKLNKVANQNSLRIRTYTTFAAKWLIPHLPDFKNKHPNIDVRIFTAVPDVDFDRDNVDMAIQFGSGQWSKTKTDLLFDDEIEPVCSPTFLASAGKKSGPSLLLGRTLLGSQFRKSDWDDWLKAYGQQKHAADAEKMYFSSSLLTWQAAIDGLGIAIGQTTLLANELKTGQLVKPFNQPLKGKKAHYLVRPNVNNESKNVLAFRAWILNSFKKSE